MSRALVSVPGGRSKEKQNMAIHQGKGMAADHAEQARLQALQDLHILDTPPQAKFNDLAWLASKLCDVPIALVSLVDANRQ